MPLWNKEFLQAKTVTLDQYLWQQAVQHKKVVAGVETAAEQCEAFNSLSDSAAVSSLNATLSDLEGFRNGSESLILTGLEKMAQNYICGWNNTVISPSTATEEAIWLSDIMLIKRNKVMASRVIKLLRTNPGSSLFFAFGTAHFTGDDSVIDLMREAGFQVKRVRVNDDLSRNLAVP